MRTLTKLAGCAALVLAFTSVAAPAQDACNLSEQVICPKLHAPLQLSCVKYSQLAKGRCRRAKKQLRFGSHEEHCRVACEAGFLAFDFSRRLHGDVLATIEASAQGNEDWLVKAKDVWRRHGAPDGLPVALCSAGELEQARRTCDAHCTSVAARRDLKELQGLAAGGDFLPLQQPVFACTPGLLGERLSRDKASLVEWLYPPGHPRRAVE